MNEVRWEFKAFQDEDCALCKGNKTHTCPVCKGTGKEDVEGWCDFGTPNGESDYHGRCRTCRGKKKVVCGSCGGKGIRVKELTFGLDDLRWALGIRRKGE